MRASAGRPVLVVEDDPAVRALAIESLRLDGIDVVAAADASSAIRLVASAQPRLATIDVGLPGEMDGLGLIRHLRSHGEEELVIMVVSGADRVDQRVAGLEAGADDYLVKPFDPAELVARVRAHLRRQGRSGTEVWRVADLTVDEGTHEVDRAGHRIELTPAEFDILCCLVRHAGHVVRHDRLLAEVWGYADAPTRSSLQVHLGHLRSKLDAYGPRLVHNVRSEGYLVRT